MSLSLSHSWCLHRVSVHPCCLSTLQFTLRIHPHTRQCRAALANMSNMKRFIARARLEDGRILVVLFTLHQPEENPRMRRAGRR